MPIAVEKLLDHRREGANTQQFGTFVSQFVLPLCLIVFKELNSNSECSDTLVTSYIFSVFLIARKSHFFLERNHVVEYWTTFLEHLERYSSLYFVFVSQNLRR